MSTPSKTSYVYVIGSPEFRPVKIGVSVDPQSRLATLQTGNPYPLALLLLTPGTSELEDSLHAQFAKFRTQGEWFDFGPIDPMGCVARAISERAGLMRPQYDSRLVAAGAELIESAPSRLNLFAMQALLYAHLAQGLSRDAVPEEWVRAAVRSGWSNLEVEAATGRVTSL